MDQETEYETEIKSHEIAESVFFFLAAINFSTNRKRDKKYKFLWNIFVSEVSEIFANSNITQFPTNCMD